MFRRATRRVVIVIAAAMVLSSLYSMRAADFPGSVQGIVKDSSGVPVSGAFVKLKNAERHLTFMVISQAQGRYTANDLPFGKYTVQGIGNGLQSEPAPVDVAEGRAATADVSLTANQPQMLKPGMPSTRFNAGYDGGPPATTLPDGDARGIVAQKCTQCHEIDRILNGRGDRPRWERTVRLMRDYAETGSAIVSITDEEGKLVVDYLTTNFYGTPKARAPRVDPNSRLPRTLLQGEATKYKIVEYEVPPPSRGFHEVTLDPRGNAWVSELTGGNLGKLDAKSLTFSEVPVPALPAGSKNVILNGMARGQGDQLWVVDPLNRRLIRHDSRTGEFNVFNVPKLKRGNPMSNSMRIHPDGSLWFTAIQSNAVVNFNPETNKFSFYDVPIAVKSANKRSAPYGMAISGDGKVWFAINEFDLMGRVDPSTGKVEEFPLPLKADGPIGPRKVGRDGNGNVWVGLHTIGKLMKIDYKTTKMTVYSPPTENAGIYGMSEVKDDKIWFAEDSVDKLGRFDSKTETFVEFPLPHAETDVRRLEADPINPKRIWYSGVSTNRIGYIELID